MSVIDKKITIKTQALIAGISEDAGLETYLIALKSIKTFEYLEFLDKLHTLYPTQQIILFLDNLSVHKTQEARDIYHQYNITPLYNVPYSP